MENARYEVRRAALAAVEAVEAPQVVTSAWIDEQLAETYERCGIRPGLLEKVAGVRERRWWDPETTFDEAAAMAGRKALAAAGLDRGDVDVLISTSVCKHHLEPSVASAVHDHLELPSSCLNFDVGNACLGFVNAMQVASAMIDAGQIRNALIVDGEGSRYTQERTIERLQRADATVEEVFAEFASLTLGSGAAAAVISEDVDRGHRIVGGVSRTASEYHTLCVGTLDLMVTDSAAQLKYGLGLVFDAWDASEATHDWHDGLDWYIFHQVSARQSGEFIERVGLDPARVPVTLDRLGNVGPASIPITLATVADQIAPGERVLCMGVGSGLNASFLEIIW